MGNTRSKLQPSFTENDDDYLRRSTNGTVHYATDIASQAIWENLSLRPTDACFAHSQVVKVVIDLNPKENDPTCIEDVCYSTRLQFLSSLMYSFIKIKVYFLESKQWWFHFD